MNKFKYFIYISSINILFAGDGGGSWINDWLMPNTGLTLWTIATFLVLLAVLKLKAWKPLMDALEARAQQIEESLSKAEKVSGSHLPLFTKSQYDSYPSLFTQKFNLPIAILIFFNFSSLLLLAI